MKNILLYLCLLFIIIFGQQKDIECTPNEIITNPRQCEPDPQKGEGFGSQLQTIIASIVYAELNNKRYVYTPFQMMAHNYNNDTDFIDKKEQFINFIGNFEIIDTLDHDKNYIVKSNIAYKAFFDTHAAACAHSLSLKKIKGIFRANKDIDHYFNNENLNVAVHIRRPNPHDNRILGTDTPDTLFLNIINHLRMIYASNNPLFHLYSQGSKENFKAFDAKDTVLHLNESIEGTFLSMVLADVLVTSASSFSYTAALLSEGIVYYIPFWHTPLPHWISVNILLKG